METIYYLQFSGCKHVPDKRQQVKAMRLVFFCWILFYVFFCFTKYCTHHQTVQITGYQQKDWHGAEHLLSKTFFYFLFFGLDTKIVLNIIIHQIFFNSFNQLQQTFLKLYLMHFCCSTTATTDVSFSLCRFTPSWCTGPTLL